MKYKELLLFPLLLALPAEARPELKVKAVHFASSAHEISGIAAFDNKILIVSDSPEDTYLYWAKPTSTNRFDLEPYLDLAKLPEFKAYLRDLQDIRDLKEKDRRFDLEGVAHCGKTIYLADERARQVIVVEESKSLRRLATDFRSHPRMMEGGSNAGLEGVAVDCRRGHLYVAKERDPRILLRVDLNTGLILKSGNIAGSDRQGQKVIDPFSGNGLMTIGPDISDLFYLDEHLYLLERNTYEVVKIHPETFAVIARVSYLEAERTLYETGEPFGVGEALLITKDEIIVGFDNNGAQLTRSAEKKYGVAGPLGALIYFQRPAGF